MSKKTFIWPNPPTTIDTAGLATEANQDTQITEAQAANASLDAMEQVLDDAATGAVPLAVVGPLTDTQLRATAVPVSAASLPLPTGAATATNQSTINTSINDFSAKTAAALVPEAFDYIDLTYVGAGNGQGEIATAVYKIGGSGGTTVATITLAYNVDNKISSVTRS